MIKGRLNNNLQGGYIGILAILIGVAVTIFVYANTYFKKETAAMKQTQTGATNTIPSAPTSNFDRMMGGIDAAKAISADQSKKATDANQLINSIR